MSVVGLAGGQTPVAVPSTMTTIAGGLTSSAYTAGTTSCPGSSKTASSKAGDNCAAVGAVLGSAVSYGGLTATPSGEVVFTDLNNIAVHLIDPTSGNMSIVAGLGTVCGSSAGKLTSAGDGCLAATQTVLSGPRGVGVDPYGNVIIPEYSQNLIHIVCRNPSPLCTAGTPAPTTANPIQVQIGYMGLVAGCAAAAGSTGTSGIGLDNTPGFATLNSTATNTSSYPATLSGSTSAFKVASSCTTSTGEVYQPRGASGDIYGNIYYADTTTSRYRVILGPYTSSYFKGNNPLYAALLANSSWTLSSLKPGYVYTLVNMQGVSTTTTTAVTTTGTACKTSITGGGITYTYSGTATALDTHSDGCPYFDSAVSPSSGITVAITADAAGNVIFTDPASTTGALRVLFVQGWASASAATTAGATGSVATAGVNMYNAIKKNNTTITPTAGFIYALAGGSSLQATSTAVAVSATPVLGNSLYLDSSTNKLAVSPAGNIYISDAGKVLFYDIYNGTLRTLITSGTAPSIGAYCNGSSGAVARSALPAWAWVWMRRTICTFSMLTRRPV